MRESTIACDTLLITYTEYVLKRILKKLLLECTMRQLHNNLTASPDDGGLLGAINADINNVIISDTMICSLEPSQLRPIPYHQKIMFDCVICNTSKYFQESLNA